MRPISPLYVAAEPTSAIMLGFTGYDTPMLLAGVDRLAAAFRSMKTDLR